MEYKKHYFLFIGYKNTYMQLSFFSIIENEINVKEFFSELLDVGKRHDRVKLCAEADIFALLRLVLGSQLVVLVVEDVELCPAVDHRGRNGHCDYDEQNCFVWFDVAGFFGNPADLRLLFGQRDPAGAGLIGEVASIGHLFDPPVLQSNLSK